ncbi:23S rRNA (adenine2030-N6)-methyltransferase [Breoghania corrubedonensis]|uniref:Ribosomal RNA large subunit methyltransferase J n=1 Tax=Breoghania corrubedonensis TaxID=665038 RepID=A0A2T5UNX2_9HYPH|nr:23S rRNA (adenine(2030)-N(6))-methyltransferase RlmJ [Breoghania corrubedonensis]PTW53216.1 23S rRNA (adenine2030-N6)-methyltransferase [Breoghania corrubedonensis]
MNYRHAYHAGNFADVLKHAVLIAILEHLKKKDKAFRVLDTHAGIGLYDLADVKAHKTGEWRDGIGRIIDITPSQQAAPLLAPYLDIVRTVNGEGPLTRYPGSPEITRRLLRPQDRLTLTELHREDHAVLAERYAGDHQVRVVEIDAWLAMGGFVPFKEKRGMVLIDPAFEEPDEYRTLAAGIFKATRRWMTGTYMAWYPIKDQKAIDQFYRMMIDTGLRKMLRTEFHVARPTKDGTLKACGLLILNPPFTLEAELRGALPWLTRILAQGAGATGTVDWLTPE